jgi:hypothetical protein
VKKRGRDRKREIDERLRDKEAGKQGEEVQREREK